MQFTFIAKIRMFAVCALAGACVAISAYADSAQKIKVACVGDSITFGDKVENRKINNYPNKLAELLGENFDVKNFGVCGAAAVEKSNYPYTTLAQYRNSLEYNQDCVVIMIGTNDTNPINWHICEPVFKADVNKLIDAYANLTSQPKIYIALPPKCFGSKYASESALQIVRAKLKEIAQERHLPIIDIYSALKERPELFSDNLHPNAEGALIIANTVFANITKQQ